MSVKLMGVVWECSLDHPEQSLLLALADHADDDGSNVYPSVGRLSWKTGYSERQVQRILKGLREQGLIEVVAEARDHRPTEYQLHLARADRKEPYESKRGDKLTPRHSGSERGDISPQRGDIAVSPEPPGGTTSSEPPPVLVVFGAWIVATDRDPSRTKLDVRRRRVIEKALKSHGLDDCLAAVRAIGADKWARGDNDRGRRFDDIEHALGNAERIERWRDATDAPTSQAARDAAALDAMMGAPV